MDDDNVCIAEPQLSPGIEKEKPTRESVPKAEGGVPHLPASIDIGEQVVGSRHTFDVMKVRNTANGPQMMAASVYVDPQVGCHDLGISSNEDVTHASCEYQSTPFFSPMPGWEAFASSKVLQIGFAPKKPGQFTALAKFEIRWSDGSVTVRETRVVGSARNLNDPPRRRPMEQHTKSVSAPAVSKEDRSLVNQVTPAALTELTHQANLASNAAASVAAKQIKGVTDAERFQKSFKREVPPGPWWADLAKIAVSMGIAGIAGALANRLGKRIIDEVSDVMEVDPKSLKDANWLKGVTDSVKEGLKSTGKGVIEAHSSSGSKGHPEEFFQHQTTMLDRVQDKNRALIEETRYNLEPHLAVDPRGAVKVMAAVGKALGEVSDNAAETQQLQTETQWVAGLAQSTNGHGTYPDPKDHEKTHHTLLMGPRNGRSRDGVLTIRVHRLDSNLEGTPQLQVIAASLHGVAQPIADHLRTMRLAEIPIPIMLDMSGTMKARITRDEGGVVRVTGKADRGGSFPDAIDPEVQNIRVGQLVLDAVLEKSLSAWNVSRVTTDDANGKS
jgi:hypothetical protein